jgi:predicted P-loop ATPase
MLVLEGRKQGQGKSSLLKILAGGDENFSDAPIIGSTNREQQEAIQGVWIYEIAELEGMSKHDVTSIKLFLSMTHDRARPAYGHKRVDRARRCVFAGTTNEDDYLRDTTGNRRYWPVKVYIKLIDLVAFERERDQLWAEAAFFEAMGEALTIPPDLWDAASVVQQARVSHDPWEDLIDRHLSALPDKSKGGKDTVKDGLYSVVTDKNGGREWHVASSYLLGSDVLAIPIDRQSNANTKRLAEVMRTLGWTKPPQTIRVGTKPCRGFTKTIVEPIPLVAAQEQKAIEGPGPVAEVLAKPKPIADIMSNLPNAVVQLKPKPEPKLGLLPLARLGRLGRG